jgi:signal transduction histidine kinase
MPQPKFTWRSLCVRLGSNLALALMYYVLADLSRTLASTPKSVTPVWPPDGLAVAATLIYGNWLLPGVCLGSFLANVGAFWNPQGWVLFLTSLLGVCGIAVGTTLGTWLGVWLLRRAVRQRYPLNRVGDSIKFLTYAGLVGPIVNATIGVAMLGFTQKVPWSAYQSVWLTWWISNVAGIFILTPVLLSWHHWLQSSQLAIVGKNLPSQVGNWLVLSREKAVEAIVLGGFIFAIGKAAFWGNQPFAYMLVPLLTWAAFRFGQPGATLAMFLIAAIAILGTVRGLGTFAGADLNYSLMGLQSFIVVVVFTTLTLVAVLSERVQAEAKLRLAFSELQRSNDALEHRTEELAGKNQQLEQTLQELGHTQAQMIQSEKMSALGNLVAGVAHEINNPVAFLKGNIQPALTYINDLFGLIDRYQQEYPHPTPVIEAEVEDIDLAFLREDLPKLMGSMSEGVERIKDISTSLRTFSRADTDHSTLYNLHDGIDSTLLILKHRLKANETRLEIAVIKQYRALPLVDCYAGQINQVLTNILSNAIDALDEVATQTQAGLTENPGCITITTSVMDDQWVQIAIADDGPGIPEPIQAQIFEPFFTTKPVGVGTGMGMSISYQIVVEKHGGQLKCVSTDGVGTTFIIQLPIQQPVPVNHLQSCEVSRSHHTKA